MAEIRSFQGLRYDAKFAPKLGDILCPPFDVISPSEQKGFYEKSPYNIIRLEHGQENPGDTPANNKYTRSAATLEEWLKKGVLKADARAAFYLHDHEFKYKGKSFVRRNLLACLRLEEWDRCVVMPHEFTRPAAKTDRFDLMRSCRANFSLPMALYQDPEGKMAALLTGKETPLETAEAGEEKHKVWAITQPEVITKIRGLLAKRPLYIADGHHRYETALAYRDAQRQAHPGWSEDDAFNFIMISLISASDPGLLLLATHRLLQGLNETSLGELKTRIDTLFKVESVPMKQLESALATMSQADRPVMGLVGMAPDKFELLWLRQAAGTKAFASLLIRVLHREVLDGVVSNSSVDYSSDIAEAVGKVQSGERQLAFIFNPTTVDEIIATSDSEELRPHMSTFFYPKPPTGLVIRRLDGKLGAV